MNLVIHPSTQTQSYVFGANPHVKPLQAVRLSEFALRLLPCVAGEYGWDPLPGQATTAKAP